MPTSFLKFYFYIIQEYSGAKVGQALCFGQFVVLQNGAEASFTLYKRIMVVYNISNENYTIYRK